MIRTKGDPPICRARAATALLTPATSPSVLNYSYSPLQLLLRHAGITAAYPPQILPRINPALVAVTPLKLQRVLAHRSHFKWLYRSLIHHQRRLFLRFRHTGQSTRLLPLLVASCAGASIPQPRKVPDAVVSVFPVDLDPCSLGLFYAHLLRS